jgi:hypothetical protein
MAVTLACLLVALTPLGHAAPPDQTWIAGLYHDADQDDVVLALAAVSPAASPRPAAPAAADPLPRALARRTPGPVALVRRLDRAPPLV